MWGVIGLVLRLVVGGVWIVAGALKLPDPAESVRAVRAYQLLPESVVPAIGYALPIVEVVVGLCLVLGVLVRVNAVVSAVLFAAFVVGISAAWARGLQIDCGCFGGGGYEAGASEKYPAEIARDVALLLASAYLAWRPRTAYALDSLLFPAHPGDEETDPETDPETPQKVE